MIYLSSLLKEVTLEKNREAVARRITSGVTPKTHTINRLATFHKNQVFAFSSPAANRVAPPLCLRPIRRLRATRAANGRPEAPRAPTNQRAVAMWEAESIRAWAF